MVIFFVKKKRKKQLQSWAIVLDLPNYISTCHSNNLHTNVGHLNLTISSWHPPLHPHHFEEFILIILDNITMCFSQPNKDKERIMKPHENKISIVDISKRGVCGSQLQVLGPIIRTNDQIFQINNRCCGQQLRSCTIQLPIARRPKPSKIVDPWVGKGFDKCNQISS